MMKGNLLFAQSGGPTAVINASAAGVIEQAIKCKKYDKVLCAHFGMDGIIQKDFVDVSAYTKKDIDLLAVTPSSAFGSCRYKLPDFEKDSAPYEQILEVFKQNNVTAFIYNGGNDSMDTCNKIARYFDKIGYNCNVIGVPKTIDNDLVLTDHCPGYGSAAKYIATTISEIAYDTSVYCNGRITICEIMGRDAGWLTASTALAKLNSNGADLIYVPEVPFNKTKFFEKAIKIFNKKGRCLVCLSEGIRDKNGKYVGAADGKDSFNHVQLGGVAAYLADVLTTKYGVKTRAVELSLPQRCAAHLAGKTDNTEARLAGRHAVELATSGITGRMVSYTRISNSPYKMELTDCDLNAVANGVKTLPLEFVTKDGDGITDRFVEYALPLIQGEVKVEYDKGLPKYFKID